ncbi:MAG: MFS transporter, partial [Armatimonadetes bacterium]|nr:MFS transporter [Armatimonadota bacterium]
LYFLVFLWWAGEIGGATAVGIVSACSVGAYLALSLYAGTVADRYDRRTILLISDIACAITVVGLICVVLIEPAPPLWVLCVFTVALKAAFVFQRPARTAAIPRLVPTARLLEANSLNTTFQTAMPLAGNALGAVVLGAVFKLSAALAYIVTFSINAVTFVLSAIFMAKLPPIVPERERPPKHAWHEAKEGIKFIWNHPVLRTSAILFFGFEFFVAPFMPAYVIAAQTTFKSGFDLFGLNIAGPALLSLLETGFFLGFVLGSFVVYKRPVYRVGYAFAVFMALGSLTIVPMGWITSIPLFWFLNFLCGLCFPFGIIPLETFMQTVTPDEFRGRMGSAIGTLSASAAPMGMLLSGFLIEWIGLTGTFAFIGIGLVITAMAGLIPPSFRRARLTNEQAKGQTPGEQITPGVLVQEAVSATAK